MVGQELGNRVGEDVAVVGLVVDRGVAAGGEAGDVLVEVAELHVRLAVDDIAKLMMKERGMDYSMSNFKALMAGTFLTKRIFDVSRYRPNQTLINHIFKELFGCAP